MDEGETLMQQLDPKDESKLFLWRDFVSHHRIKDDCVPLFQLEGRRVETTPFGRDNRPVLKRSGPMEDLMRKLGRDLIEEHRQSNIQHDGILYMMLTQRSTGVIPLYIGKAELFGKGDRNLSVNISDLDRGKGKFGRWGYNYAYHLGDLSAVTCPGHSTSKKTKKYESWRNKLFSVDGQCVTSKIDILFWATNWGEGSQSIWRQYGHTKLAFEEYLLIGVASDVFPDDLLNHEGRNR
ncbi:MAG: hypothetical protein QF752_10280 [Planctomycetota bacterium]|jgi:hypothetical protein|nr:hypothetical protein [Planctomycetota bacterium]